MFYISPWGRDSCNSVRFCLWAVPRQRSKGMGVIWMGSWGEKTLFQIKWKASGQWILDSCRLFSGLLSSWFVPTLQSEPTAHEESPHRWLSSLHLDPCWWGPSSLLQCVNKGSCAADSDEDGDCGGRLKHNPCSLSLSHPSLCFSSFVVPLDSQRSPRVILL